MKRATAPRSKFSSCTAVIIGNCWQGRFKTNNNRALEASRESQYIHHRTHTGLDTHVQYTPTESGRLFSETTRLAEVRSWCSKRKWTRLTGSQPAKSERCDWPWIFCWCVLDNPRFRRQKIKRVQTERLLHFVGKLKSRKTENAGIDWKKAKSEASFLCISPTTPRTALEGRLKTGQL